MIKRLVIAITFFIGLSTIISAQSLGDFKPKENRGPMGPRKFKSKDVYVANFSVNFQLFNLKTASTSGEFSGRTLSGNTKASLAVGLDIPVETLQQITDEAYQKFVKDLEANGFNVLNGEAAANTEFYKAYQRFDNMEMSLSEAPGLVTVYPQSRPFFIKGFAKDGQKKQGGFFGEVNRVMNDDGRYTIESEIATYPKLSAELNDAIIVNADMYVLFLDVKKPYQGKGAKILANTNLRLASFEHVKSRVANNSLSAKVGLANSSKEQTYLCVSAVDFVSGRNKIGGSAIGTYSGVLKSDLEINDVIGKEKIQAYARENTDYLGTSTAFGRVYLAENISVENTAVIHTDATKYQDGVRQGIDTFLGHHIGEFKKKFFK